MRRREFIAGLGGAAAMPLIGILCIIISQQGQAQQAGCTTASMCIADQAEPAATQSDQTFIVTRPSGPPSSERCPGTSVDVTAASPDDRHLACLAARDAIQLLGRCGITPRQALHVDILSVVHHPFGGTIFGFLDTKRNRIRVTQKANIPSLVKDTPYARLPQRDFYRSLIVHEVVHGVMHQNLKRPASSHAAHEYAAYALQIESFTRPVRNKFLRSFDRSKIKTSFVFSDVVLFIDPYYFAARAYLHFNALGNGCAHLTALLEGDVTFIAPSRI